MPKADPKVVSVQLVECARVMAALQAIAEAVSADARQICDQQGVPLELAPVLMAAITEAISEHFKGDSQMLLQHAPPNVEVETVTVQEIAGMVNKKRGGH